MKNKEIRFIDSHYNEKFRINDGDKIKVTMSDGRTETRTCKYIDDYHFYADSRAFHICEYAELMEKNGNKVEPANNKRTKKRDLER